MMPMIMNYAILLRCFQSEVLTIFGALLQRGAAWPLRSRHYIVNLVMTAGYIKWLSHDHILFGERCFVGSHCLMNCPGHMDELTLIFLNSAACETESQRWYIVLHRM